MTRASTTRLILLALIWGSGFYFIAIALRSMSPVQLTFARLALGAAVLVPVVILREGRLPRRRRLWGHLAVAALLGNALPYTLFAFAQEHLASGVAGVINATTPLWTVAFQLAAGTRDVPRLRLIGLTVGFAGTLLIFAPWGDGTGVATAAGMLALAAAASYGLSYVYQHRYLTGEASPLALSAGQLLMATGLLAVTVPVAGLQTIHLRADALLALLVLGVIGTGAGYVLNYRLIADEGPAASIVSYLIPVVAVVLGATGLGEPLNIRVLVGAAIVLVGVALSTRAPRRSTDALGAPARRTL
jgi:drug/metabolite transporter (DMT)-like permease